jgi:hypothetical protein
VIGRVVWLLISALLFGGAHAATIELRFVSPNGSGIAGIRSWLRAQAPQRAQHLCDESDPQGRAACPPVEPGEYTIVFSLPKQSHLADPVEAGLVPELNFAVTATDQVLRFEIPIPRADVLYTTTNLGAPLSLTAVEEATGNRRESRIDSGGSAVSFSPGRWQLTLRLENGYLIESIELDGRSITTMPFPLEVFDLGSRRTLNLTLVEACRIAGTLSWLGADHPPGVIVATLIEPGPLMARSMALGFPAEARYEARPDTKGRYMLILPDGRWRLSVEGSNLATIEPEEIVLGLAAGDRVQADFRVTVETKDDADAGSLRVELVPPEGLQPQFVRGELRRANEGDQPGEVVRESEGMERRIRPVLSFGSIPSGRYIVVAGALNAAEVASEPIEIEQGDTLERQLPVAAAGVINARISPAPNQRLVAIELLLELIAPLRPDDPRLVDPAFRAAKDRRRGRFDLAGKLRFEGVTAGRYRLSARFVDPSRVDTKLHLRVGELSAFDRMELDLAGTGSIELTLELVPAARVSGVVKCLDGESLPRRVDLRLIAESIDPPAETAEPYSFDSIPFKAKDDAVLVGPDLNELAAGPFEPEGAYVALRPHGFARWTWAFGTEDPSRAAVVEFVENKAAELGSVNIDCRPSVKLLFATPHNETIPDLQDLAVILAEVRTVPRPGIDEPFGAWHPASPEIHAEFVRLKGLPIGRSVVRAQLRHRFFIPNLISIEERSQARTLALGAEDLVQVGVPELGGAIKLPVGVAALRLSMPGGSTSVVDGNSLMAGVYQVEACADVACDEVIDRWNDVVVEPGKDTVLSHAEEP